MKILKVIERGRFYFIETDVGTRRVLKHTIKNKDDIRKLFETTPDKRVPELEDK